ncbi:MAG: hypothetical protein H6702_01690 [Myxococcales bacterium]|nr:hypothetical protein [Myxococcales bacterium]
MAKRSVWWALFCAGVALSAGCSGDAAAPGGGQQSSDAMVGAGGGGAGGAGGAGGGGGVGGAACTPGPEICNGQDDDCDRAVDEQAAEVGEACGQREGVCEVGINICTGGALVCSGGVLPSAEVCNGLDDDCDGTADEEIPGVGEPCGDCGGRTICIGGRVRCDGDEPRDEICDGLDNDCDGTADEAPTDIGGACGGEGECSSGVWVCLGGERRCEGQSAGTDETCNGLDDDCDGRVDEAAPRVGEPCDGGRCGQGQFVCANGRLGCFVEDVGQGSPEVCDGRDNDCDGAVDEADPQVGMPCGSDVGECIAGELSCVAGTVICLGGTPAVTEICDRRDNDCDGRTDEGDDSRGGVPCPGPGDPCEINRNCASDICFSDYGTRYCSAECDPMRPDCPAGLVCETRGQENRCVQRFPNCETDRDCAAGTRCMLTPARSPDLFGGQCRPQFEDGLPDGASCGADNPRRCASGTCVAGPNTCGNLCRTPAECADGLVCVLTPFILGNGDDLELGLCLPGCTRDTQCSPDGSLLCQYGRQGDRAAVIGYCDTPFPGGGVGEACDYFAEPPLTCAHGFCQFRDGNGYCANGCAGDEDCLDGWTCRLRPYGNAGLTIGLCDPP